MEIDQVIALWFHYETVAMHFNELIIQYRLQLMGGAGAIGALSGYFIGSKVKSPFMRHKLRAYVSSVLLLLLLAAFYLDVYYYNELLRGAVSALLKLESEYSQILYMSTAIKEQFSGGATKHIYIAYSFVLFPLVLFTGWSWSVCYNDSKKIKITNKDGIKVKVANKVEPLISKVVHVYFPFSVALFVLIISIVLDLYLVNKNGWFQRSGAVVVAISIYIAFHENRWRVRRVTNDNRESSLHINTQIWYRWLALVLGVIGTLVWGYGDLYFNLD